jgi:hypothetical protein
MEGPPSECVGERPSGPAKDRFTYAHATPMRGRWPFGAKIALDDDSPSMIAPPSQSIDRVNDSGHLQPRIGPGRIGLWDQP